MSFQSVYRTSPVSTAFQLGYTLLRPCKHAQNSHVPLPFVVLHGDVRKQIIARYHKKPPWCMGHAPSLVQALRVIIREFRISSCSRPAIPNSSYSFFIKFLLWQDFLNLLQSDKHLLRKMKCKWQISLFAFLAKKVYKDSTGRHFL